VRTRPKWKPHPPKTRRMCPVCEKITTFQYDPGVFHSRCKECGAFPDIGYKDNDK